MTDKIAHEVVTGDLDLEIYTYWFDDQQMRLVLDDYERFERPSKRHSWRMAGRWNRLERARFLTMTYEDVPQLSSDVRAEILRKFVEQITIE